MAQPKVNKKSADEEYQVDDGEIECSFAHGVLRFCDLPYDMCDMLCIRDKSHITEP